MLDQGVAELTLDVGGLRESRHALDRLRRAVASQQVSPAFNEVLRCSAQEPCRNAQSDREQGHERLVVAVKPSSDAGSLDIAAALSNSSNGLSEEISAS